jgi:hypothetical protein
MNHAGINKTFGSPNKMLLFGTTADSFVRQQILELAVFLRLYHSVSLPIRHYLTCLILLDPPIEPSSILSLCAMQQAFKLPAVCPVRPNSALNDSKALDKSPRL